jgi:micrococcal nuclease
VPTPGESVPRGAPLPQYVYTATVTDVHDGDTVTLAIDLGFYVNIVIKARLYGINAPELGTQAGKVSRSMLLGMLRTMPGPVTVLTKSVDKYGGRWDCVIWNKDGVNLNEWLVLNGYAVPLAAAAPPG